MVYKTTAAKYCADLEDLCWKDTFYKNIYPYNLLYCYGDGRFSADCNNLIKALVNGRDIQNAKKGSYQLDLSLTGDVNEAKLLGLCANVTTDFSGILSSNIPRVLYMDGHVGTYLGYEVEYFGATYNTVECTAWTGDVGHDGVIYSYVDTNGNRRYHKGGAIKSKWTKHGDMTTLVDCSIISEKAKVHELTYQENWMCEQFCNDARNIVQRGKDNLYANVVFVQSYLAWYGYYAGDLDGDYGKLSESAAMNWQKNNGLYADGIIGPKSWAVIRKG